MGAKSRSITFTWHLSAKQRELFESKARFRVSMAGRRFGKNEVLTACEVDYAVSPSDYEFGADDPTDVLIWHVAPTYRQAYRHGYLKVREKLPDLLLDLDNTRGSEWSPSKIQFNSGVEMEFLSYGNPKGLQGEGVDLIGGDEWAYSDPEIWDADLRPMLLDNGGGGIFISKPLGENHFYKMYQRGATASMPHSTSQDRADGWYSVHATSYDNPLIPDSEIDSVREQTPDRIFRREYLADPETGGKTFNREMFKWIKPTDMPGDIQTVIGVDPAATADAQKANDRDSDFWGVTVAYNHPRKGELFVADTVQRRGMTLKEGASFVQAVCKETEGNPEVIVESNQSQRWLQQELSDRGVNAVPVNTSRNKEDKIIDLSIPVSNGTVKFLEWDENRFEELHQQMLAWPESNHDDMIDSLSLVVNHAQGGSSIFSSNSKPDLW